MTKEKDDVRWGTHPKRRIQLKLTTATPDLMSSLLMKRRLTTEGDRDGSYMFKQKHNGQCKNASTPQRSGAYFGRHKGRVDASDTALVALQREALAVPLVRNCLQKWDPKVAPIKPEVVTERCSDTLHESLHHEDIKTLHIDDRRSDIHEVGKRWLKQRSP